MMDVKDLWKGVFFGAIVGDIYGAPYEFEPREFMESHEEQYKSGQYHAGGPFNLNTGEFTDDTSMMLCLAKSYIDCQGTNQQDQIERYISWYKDGYMSSNGRCFDIGIQTQKALNYYIKNKELLPRNPSAKSSGNGAMMRMAPTVILFDESNDRIEQLILQNSVTHDDTDVHCYGIMLMMMISYTIHAKDFNQNKNVNDDYLRLIDDGRQIAGCIVGDIFKEYEPHGSGYVKDSLAIAYESFINTNNFLDSLIHTISYGQDTDTNACITGMLAGAEYGFSGIPKNLIDGIKYLDVIEDIFEDLYSLKLSKFARG